MNSDPYFKNFRLVIHESGVKNAISSPTKPIRIVSNNRHLTGVAIKSKRRMIPSRRSRELIYRGEKLGHRPAGTRPPLLPFAFELVTHARTHVSPQRGHSRPILGSFSNGRVSTCVWRCLKTFERADTVFFWRLYDREAYLDREEAECKWKWCKC